MKRLSIFFVTLLLFSCSLSQPAADPDYLPRTPGISESIFSVDVELLRPDDRLSVLSIQGLANRGGGRIYTFVDQDRWVLDFYKEKGYVKRDSLITDIAVLIRTFRDHADGVVIYDPEKPFTVNIATNIAGVMNCVIASPENCEAVREALGKNVLYDLCEMDFPDRAAAFAWYMEHIFPLQDHRVLSVAGELSFMYDVYRDWLIEFKVPVFWLPGPLDADYDPLYERMVLDMFERTPANIPVLGFWPGSDMNGQAVGYEEFDGVRLAGLYGKFTLVNTWVGNYSFHSGVDPGMESYYQEKPRTKPFQEYDPGKKYVALVMNESGDAPCYFLYTGFYPRQWSDPARGQVAINYGITPSLRMLAPAILADMYRTQTGNDFFFTSISGAGYCYPFEGYGQRTESPEAVIRDYFTRITGESMKMLDHDMLAVYTHSNRGWDSEDRKVAERSFLAVPGVSAVVSGMHRTEYTAADAHEMYGDKSIHHTVTFWSYDDLRWDDVSLDEKAVDHLEDEIKAYGADGQFILAMFYSWHYGPRRLKMLQDRLAPQGYEFVTLNEFDHLWRQSLK